jgi:branched-chain amino acid transport system ATP-binding protein
MSNGLLMKISAMSISFGGVKALDDYRLELAPSHILGVIGPNGAGKTTLFNLITGFIRPDAGHIHFDDEEITDWEPYRIARKGISRSFQNICLFDRMSVLDNVIVSCQIRQHPYLLSALFKTSGFRRNEKKLQDRARQLLSVFGLEKQADQRAMSLSYGDQRRLEIARALAARPKLLMIDEPAAGMNPRETEDLLALILKLRIEFDLTIILIEHNMNLVMPLCETIQVLNYGKLVAEGTPVEIQQNPEVIDAYLGDENDIASHGS